MSAFKHGQLPYKYAPNLVYHTALGFALQERRGPQRLQVLATAKSRQTSVFQRGSVGAWSGILESEWILRFIGFHGRRHPNEMREPEVAAFLTWLAVDQRVAASTQNQALNALNFLYKAVLNRPLGNMPGVVRARTPKRLPIVLTTDEVGSLLRAMDGDHWLPACLMYGSDLRLMEAVRLRIKDIDFEHRAIVVRTTQIYTHVLKRGGAGVLGPLGSALNARHGDNQD